MNINVLDHGFIRHVESWGRGDANEPEAGIIEAARQSTQGAFRGWDTDEKLLGFLYNNKPPHATPFEFAGMVIEVQAPIFVFREWHRHRTQCLAGDTLINLVSPRGTTYKRTIQQIFQLKYGGVTDEAPAKTKNGYSKAGTPVLRDARHKDPWRTRILPNCQGRVLRTFDEEAGEYRFGAMQDVWESGVKELWEVVTDKGVVRASAVHPFYTSKGWAKLCDLSPGDLLASSGKVATRDRPIPPSLRQGIGVWTTMMRKRLIQPEDTCHACGGVFAFDQLDLDHVIPVNKDLTKALDETNLKPACHECHQKKISTEQPDRVGQTALGVVWTKILSKPVRVAEEMTYDLEMAGPDHNYVANGLVVHNSYNEMSARYAPLPDLNYVPTVDRLMLGAKATNNKQAGTIKGAEVITEEGALEFQRGLIQTYTDAELRYQAALASGVPKELARCHMPVGRYSKMRASTCLRNWLAFLTLRADPGAQWEIQMFAQAVAEICRREFPRTMALFDAGRLPNQV